MTVGIGPCDVLGADRSPGAGTVLDDERLRKHLRHVVGEKPCSQIHDAAGLVGHDQADRPARPILGFHRYGTAQNEGCEQRQGDAGNPRPAMCGRRRRGATKGGF
jgi:hypothetical protein